MKIRYSVLAFLASILIVACNTDDEVSVLPKDKIIGVEPQVSDAVVSRAQFTIDSLKKTGFGMYVISNNPNYCYNKYKWIWDNTDGTSGYWYSAKINEGLTPIKETLKWENDKSSVNIIAFSPFQGNVWTDVVTDEQPVNIAIQSAILDYDYLYAQSQVTPSGNQNTDNDIYYDKATEKLAIKFKHRFSKLNISLNLGTEFNDKDNGNATEVNPVAATSDCHLELIGPLNGGKWNLSTNKITLYSYTGSEGRITWINNNVFANCIRYTKGVGTSKGGIVRYDFIVFPQTVNKDYLKVAFYINGQRYVWKADKDYTFEQGKLYNLMLNVGNVVTTAGWSVTDWNENSSTNITMQ